MWRRRGGRQPPGIVHAYNCINFNFPHETLPRAPLIPHIGGGGVWLKSSGFSKELQNLLLECYVPDKDSKAVERVNDFYFRGLAVWMPRR